MVEANRYIEDNELRSQCTSSIEVPEHLADIVREKLGISKPKHKFSQYDPYNEEVDAMDETINYEAQED